MKNNYFNNCSVFFKEYKFDKNDRDKNYNLLFGIPLKNNILSNPTKITKDFFERFIKDIKTINKSKSILTDFKLTKIGLFKPFDQNNKKDCIMLDKIIECIEIIQNNKNNKIITVRDYALRHDTHNPKIKEIVPRKEMILYINSDSNEYNILNNSNNSNNLKDILIIFENGLTFEQNENQKKYYLNNFDFNKPDTYTNIYGKGYWIVNINKNKTIKNKQIFYFGDIDNEGYKIFKSLEKKINNGLEHSEFNTINFVFPKKEVYFNLQNELKKNYDSELNQENKNKYCFIEDKILIEVLAKRYNTNIVHHFCIFEESFVCF